MTDPPMSATIETVAIAANALDVGYLTPSGAVAVVLKGFNLVVPEGEFLTIIGPSGCGKSTFLRAAADLLQPVSGSLAVFGGLASAARKRRDVSFVFQDSEAFGIDIRHNFLVVKGSGLPLPAP
jgi:NitT/TauT family transport system ATP-binding protein